MATDRFAPTADLPRLTKEVMVLTTYDTEAGVLRARKHGREVRYTPDPAVVQVFVRDRGQGFNMDEIAVERRASKGQLLVNVLLDDVVQYGALTAETKDEK